MESFGCDGIFWLPGAEDRQCAGRLTFDSATGASLGLLGSLSDLGSHFGSDSRICRIHGLAGKRYLTLDGCQVTNSTMEIPGISRQTYYVGRIIANHLFGDGEELTFDKCSVSLDQLPVWIRRSGVRVQLDGAPGTNRVNRVRIEFTEQEDEIADLGAGEKLRLGSTWTLSGDHVSETGLRQGIFLEIAYSGVRPLDEALDDVKHLQDLLTLATAAPAVPLEITLQRKDVTREISAGNRIPQDMQFYAGQLAEHARLAEPQSAGHVLFQFKDIGGLPTIARWIKVARQYKPVLGALLSIRYSSGLYTENRFHNVMSAAETFHRMRFPNEARPAQEFREFRRGLIKAVPAEHRNWLGNQLQYSNEPRLKRRLAEMADYAGEAFAAVYDDTDTWVAVAAASRNRLIHHDEEQEIKFQPGDLHFLAESIFSLVMLCLFRECEVRGSVLAGIGDSGSVQFLRGKLNEIVPRIHAQVP